MSTEKTFVPSVLSIKETKELEKAVAAELKESANASVADEDKNKEEFQKLVKEAEAK